MKNREKQIQIGSQIYRTLFENFSATVADVTATIPGFEKISEKITSRQTNLFAKMCAALDGNELGLDVLCHGDLWANIILFSKDGGLDAILCDFQLVYRSSPAYDLVYSLFTSSHEDLREHD